jgi:hypothetical protein
LLFNPGPAIDAAGLIIKKTVPFWPSFIQGFRDDAVATENYTAVIYAQSKGTAQQEEK